MVEKQVEEEKCPVLRPKGLHIGQGLTPHPIAGLSWTGVQLANSIKGNRNLDTARAIWTGVQPAISIKDAIANTLTRNDGPTGEFLVLLGDT